MDGALEQGNYKNQGITKKCDTTRFNQKNAKSKGFFFPIKRMENFIIHVVHFYPHLWKGYS